MVTIIVASLAGPGCISTCLESIDEFTPLLGRVLVPREAAGQPDREVYFLSVTSMTQQSSPSRRFLVCSRRRSGAYAQYLAWSTRQ